MEEIRSLLKYYAGSFSLDEQTGRVAAQLLDQLYDRMKKHMVGGSEVECDHRQTLIRAMCHPCSLKTVDLRDN